MKKILFLLLGVLFCAFLFAQDSTGTGEPSNGFSLSNNIVLILTIIVGVYELIIRNIPTVANWSILGWIIKIIQVVIPNKNVAGKQPHP